MAAGTPNTITNPVYSYTPTLTWVHGGHNIKLGMQYIQQGSKTYQPQYGDFGFTNTTTGDPNNVGTTGNSLASALLGYPATNGNTPPTTQGNRVANYAGYAEDAWTISRSVTFTYGLRADHRRPFAPIAGSLYLQPGYGRYLVDWHERAAGGVRSSGSATLYSICQWHAGGH